MIALKSELLFTLTGKTAAPIEFKASSIGRRRVVAVEGGDFEGPKLRGRILPGGTDCMLVRPDGVVCLDVRMPLETHDGERIFMCYKGLRHGPPEVMEQLARGETVDPSKYYFRITPWFETGAEKYDWLNRIVAVGTGERLASGPVYYVYEVL